MTARYRPQEIAERLSELDEDFALVVELVGPPPNRRAIPAADRFARLATAILHQQLAGKAAATITARTIDALGELSPEQIAHAPDGLLRTCGVSGAKEAALRDLSAHVLDGRLDFSAISRQDDDAVVAELSAVRGIGRWTAEMFLMGPLGRHDVWPVGDLGVRNGFGVIKERAAPSPRMLDELGEPYRPFRSSVAWYCWQAVDLARDNGGTLPR